MMWIQIDADSLKEGSTEKKKKKKLCIREVYLGGGELFHTIQQRILLIRG